MEYQSNHLKLSAIAVGCVLLLGGCAAIDNVMGRLKINNDQHQEGIQSLKSATQKDPTDASYKVDYLQKRDEHVRTLITNADKLRAEGAIAAAQAVYQSALDLDPGNARAETALKFIKQDMRFDKLLTEGEQFLKTSKLDLAANRAEQVLAESPRNQRANRLQEAVGDARNEAEIALERYRAAKNVLDTPVTLQFNEATIKTVFESISKSTNINILLDKDVKTDSRATVFIKDVSLSDAIDLVLMQNQLRKRVVNGNTLMIFPATASKQAEYEDLTIKTYQITNADIKYLSGMLKSMLKIKEMSADEKTGILVLRDTPELLRMADRLIASHDVADPEIMLEVEILEVSESRDSNLGLKPPTGITISTPGTGNSLTLGALGRLTKDDLLASQLQATLNFKLEDATANILASPRIRARNKETAKIMIGDRVPTVSSSITPGSGGASIVSNNVTYQDVGLKLEVESQVYANDEVGIKINLEVSNIAKEFTDNNGGRSYQIGTRNALTNLRLKDGETQILGGLITDSDRNTASKIPGLGHLPVVGRIFGNNLTNGGKSEIILAITPRIVRNLPQRTPEVKQIFSGTLNTVREKPILADPITELKLVGSVSGDALASTGGAPAGAPAIITGPSAPKPSNAPSVPRTTFPSTFGSSPSPLGGGVGTPPPMIKR